jgi:hypothetical protein
MDHDWSGTSVELSLQFGIGRWQKLGKDLGPADDRHEVRVTRPARHDVFVQVHRNAGACCLAQVDAHVEASGRERCTNSMKHGIS